MSVLQTCLVVCGLLVPCGVCFGQGGKAELFGSIQDQAGLRVESVRVSAQQEATGTRFEALTNGRGDYHLLGLSAGRYLLKMEKTGFRTYVQTGITMRIGDQTRLDAKLEVGEALQSVNVEEEALLLETASGAVNHHVNRTQIETLPLDGRNFIPLITLSPGVALPSGGSLLPRINGSRPRTNEYLYDGISVLQPEPDRLRFTRSSMPWRSFASTSMLIRRSTGGPMGGLSW